ncbi:MAG: acyltransferase [Verrucomicrobia bacterium]|nr:acyltransferase [Verrucomicrobiota bacterium]
MKAKLRSLLCQWFGWCPLFQIAVGGYRYYRHLETLTPAPSRFLHYGRNVRLGESIQITAPERCYIGDNAAIGSRTVINAVGGFYLGEYSAIADECWILTTEHRFHGATELPYDGIRQIKPVHIGDYAWIGIRTTILSGVRIGDGAVVAMGSVLVRDVPPLCIVSGNPAEIVGKRPAKEFEELRAKRRGRDPFEDCSMLWVPPFIQRKYRHELKVFGLDVAPGEEHFVYDKHRRSLVRVSNRYARKAVDHGNRGRV